MNANQKNPKSWIYRVATNLTYNHLNRKSRFRKIITAMGDFSSNNHSPTSEEEYLNKKKKELIRRSLNQLPFRDQVIINLQQSGLTYKEISTVLKIKKTSVGKILSRAIEKLACQVRQEQNKKMKTVKKGGKNGMFKQKKI